MNVPEFTYLLNHPETVNEKSTDELDKIVSEFPYFQSARALRLKGLYNEDSFRYNYALKVAAAFTTDRSVLFDFITSDSFVSVDRDAFQKKHQDLLEIEVSQTSEELHPEELTLDESLRASLDTEFVPADELAQDLHHNEVVSEAEKASEIADSEVETKELSHDFVAQADVETVAETHFAPEVPTDLESEVSTETASDVTSDAISEIQPQIISDEEVFENEIASVAETQADFEPDFASEVAVETEPEVASELESEETDFESEIETEQEFDEEPEFESEETSENQTEVPAYDAATKSVMDSIKEAEQYAKSLNVSSVEEVLAQSEVESEPEIQTPEIPEFVEEKQSETEEKLEIGKPLDFSTGETHSFHEWLQLSKFQPIVREDEAIPEVPEEIQDDPENDASEDDSERQKKNELIDKFIESNPKIPKITPETKAPTFIFEPSQADNSYLMTETLARVYLEQKKYDKAIQAYEILILKYPEKNSFFADRILDIKSLQQNNKF